MSKQSRDYALAKLTEELGELLQVCGKLAAFPHGQHPDGGPPLLLRFAEESGDVYAALRYFREEHGLAKQGEYDNPTDLWARICRKLSLFRAFGESRTANVHQLWVKQDKGVPSQLLDSNGDVVLGQCRVCGKAEVELEDPCNPHPTFDHQTGPLTRSIPFSELIEQSKAKLASMTPAEREAMWAAQKASWARQDID